MVERKSQTLLPVSEGAKSRIHPKAKLGVRPIEKFKYFSVKPCVLPDERGRLPRISIRQLDARDDM